MKSESIAAYASAQSPPLGGVCEKLQAPIDAALPNSTSTIWHGSPVWFMGENPVVGWAVRAERVDLLFWSGQQFDEPLARRHSRVVEESRGEGDGRVALRDD